MEIIGIVAGCCTTGAFVPQVLHTWRTKSVEDISLRMYLLFTIGVALWLIYGFYIEALSVILANVVTLILAASVLAMKLRYRNRPPKSSE